MGRLLVVDLSIGVAVVFLMASVLLRNEYRPAPHVTVGANCSLPSLYERLGGIAKIAPLCSDIYDKHASDPITAARFHGKDHAQIKRHVTAFFASGTGGSQVYNGRTMAQTHRNMNIGHTEFYRVVEHVAEAMTEHGYGTRELGEVLAILYSLKNEILHH